MLDKAKKYYKGIGFDVIHSNYDTITYGNHHNALIRQFSDKIRNKTGKDFCLENAIGKAQ